MDLKAAYCCHSMIIAFFLGHIRITVGTSLVDEIILCFSKRQSLLPSVDLTKALDSTNQSILLDEVLLILVYTFFLTHISNCY